MGTLKINCQLSESQMDAIIREVERKLYALTPREVEDFDDEMHGVRVCVDYSNFLDKVSIKASEILNADWDLLDEDTAVFSSRMKAVIDNYNRESAQSYEQSADIRNERPYCHF